MHDVATRIGQAAVFATLSPEARERLASLGSVRSLRSGDTLYDEGDDPTHFFLALSGRLRLSVSGQVVGYVGRFEPVGAASVLTSQPRASTVHAIRDSVVLAIRRDLLVEFLQAHPAALFSLSSLQIGRLRAHDRDRRGAANEDRGTFAILPASPGAPVSILAEALVRSLGSWPSARLVSSVHVDATLGPGAAGAPLGGGETGRRVSEWLDELEGRHQQIVYAADDSQGAWAERCRRQADRLLYLAEASSGPNAAVGSEISSAGLAPVELVLLRADGDPSPYTLAWRERTGARAHYFLHPWDAAELGALARQVTGRGIGLVLGGGGARGFAHIGLVRALEQLEISVDVIGGTSMGAFLSALLACGADSIEMAQIAKETFVNGNYLNDYSLPRVSLIRGRKFLARLREVFGDRQIEELRRTYFCVSSNLTSGETLVHDRGSLAAWVGTSMAVPGIAPPVAYEGDLLCDGGLVDNLPTDVMESLERGSIIACNVSTKGALRAPGTGLGNPDPDALLDWKGPGSAPGLHEILIRTATLAGDTSTRQAAERAAVYLHMPVQDIRMFDWSRLDELVERGYEHAITTLTPLREQLQGHSAFPRH